MSYPVVARSRNLICSYALNTRLDLFIDGIKQPRPRVLRVIDSRFQYSASMSYLVDSLLFYGIAGIAYSLDGEYFNVISPGYMTIRPDGCIELTQPLGDGWAFCPIYGHHEGVVRFGRNAIMDGVSINRALRRAADNPIPLAELHQTTPNPPVSADEARELVRTWSEAMASKDSKAAYTPSSIQLITHGQVAEVALTVGKPIVDVDIARVMGVPASAVDASVSSGGLQYGNPESRARDILSTGVQPYLLAIERAISENIYGEGVSVKFDTSQIVAGDLATRAMAYSAAEAAGIMTVEEARDQEQGPNNE